MVRFERAARRDQQTAAGLDPPAQGLELACAKGTEAFAAHDDNVERAVGQGPDGHVGRVDANREGTYPGQPCQPGLAAVRIEPGDVDAVPEALGALRISPDRRDAQTRDEHTVQSAGRRQPVSAQVDGARSGQQRGPDLDGSVHHEECGDGRRHERVGLASLGQYELVALAADECPAAVHEIQCEPSLQQSPAAVGELGCQLNGRAGAAARRHGQQHQLDRLLRHDGRGRDDEHQRQQC